MKYASVCDGIGAAHVAWQPLGWQCAWVSEVDAFCNAVVDQRFGFENVGDMTKIEGNTSGTIDILVGGTPCQSFSVAGKRAGLDDPRGNLALVFLRLAGQLRPRWIVWENVPGVLSSGDGRDFGTILGTLGKLGYGFAYRTLDAQFFGVPQQRRRVFIVGHLGDWRRAAAVLFERESLYGNTPKSGNKRADVTSALTRGLGSGGADAARAQAGWLPVVTGSLTSRCGDTQDDQQTRQLVPCLRTNPYNNSDPTMEARMIVTHALTSGGHDASEDGTGRGTPLVFNWQAGGSQDCLGVNEHRTGALQTNQTPAVAFQTRIARNGRGQPKEKTDALTSAQGGTHADSKPHIAYSGGVRRLTPRECERLQGFPDDYTLVQFRGKPASDSRRYAAIGNSMATPVMRWIGMRIAAVAALCLAMLLPACTPADSVRISRGGCE